MITGEVRNKIDPGRLPEDITIERLLEGDYLSFTRNRKIAGIFKEVGLIEKYGTGIKRILKGFLDYGLPVPRFEQIGGMFRVTAFTEAESPAEKGITGGVTDVVTGVVAGEVSQEIIRIATICTIPKSREELMAELGLKHEDHFCEGYLLPAMETGIIEQTIPNKPTRGFQKYWLTDNGRKLLHPCPRWPERKKCRVHRPWTRCKMDKEEVIWLKEGNKEGNEEGDKE